jgi:hypothetical protein
MGSPGSFAGAFSFPESNKRKYFKKPTFDLVLYGFKFPLKKNT